MSLQRSLPETEYKSVTLKAFVITNAVWLWWRARSQHKHGPNEAVIAWQLYFYKHTYKYL